MKIFGKDLPFYYYDEYNKCVEDGITKYYLEVNNRKVLKIEFTYEDDLTYECNVDFEDNPKITFVNTIYKRDINGWLISKKRNEIIDFILKV